MDYANVLGSEPYDFFGWLVKEFSTEIPKEIVTIEEMNEAQALLLELASKFSYLSELASYAKIATRELKRVLDSDKTPENRRAYEDMVDKKEAVQNFAEIMKSKYAAVSRAVTIKTEINKELGMSAY